MRDRGNWRPWAIVLLLATVLAYLPAFRADFVQWDDQYYVTKNTVVQDPNGLGQIWNPSLRAIPQYYPLTFTSYWIENRLFGLDAPVYHTTNIALHLVNVMLVLALVLSFGESATVAGLTAAIFALHPVQVGSVAWIAERKNTLSAVFYLISFLLYLRHRRSRSWGAYAGCLATFGLALLGKAQTVTLPASLFVADWALQRLGRLPRIRVSRLVARVVPLLGIGAVAVWITMGFEAKAWTPNFPLLERLLIATNALWFYAATFVGPWGLSPIYPQWQITPSDPQLWVAPALLAVFAAVLAYERKHLPPLLLWGVAQFGLGVLPALGLISFNMQTYAFVANHFMYWSCIGGGLIVAMGIERLLLLRPKRRTILSIGMAAIVILGGATTTYSEATHWRTNETFWIRVLTRNPNGFVPNYNLGNHYRALGKWSDAVGYYRRAASIWPKATYAFRRYAEALRNAQGPDRAISMCTERLALDPGYYPANLERGISYEQLGRAQEATRDYDRVLRAARRGVADWEEAGRRLDAIRSRPPQSR